MAVIYDIEVGVDSAKRRDALASIVIVTFNSRHYLKACLDSLRAGTEDSPEVIVVDNASTDGSPELIQDNWPDVKLLCNTSNLGFAAACNQGAAYATGEYLVFLNQDTEVRPGWLGGLLSHLDSSEVGLVTSKLLLMSQPQRINLCGQEVHYTGLSFSRGFLKLADQYNSLAIVNAVSGASFAIKRQLWLDLGGFDKTFFMYYEETDLCWRAQLAGYRCLYTPTSVAYHDYRSSKPTYLKLYYSKRNRYILLLKHWHWLTMLLLTPALLLAEVLDWGQVVILGKTAIRAKLAAYGWLVKNLPWVLKARHSTQRQRRQSDLVLLETCVASVQLQELPAGILASMLLVLCNGCFQLNYWVARKLLSVKSGTNGVWRD